MQGYSALRSALDGLLHIEGCSVGLCVRVLEGPRAGESVGVGENVSLPSASLIKVLILTEFLRQSDSGQVSLEDKVLVTEEDLVEYSEMLEKERLPAEVYLLELAGGMIAVSDNAATNLLIRRLGMENVNVLARDLGLRRTTLRREMMDFEAKDRGVDNLTSASDMVSLLEGIWRGPLLLPEARTRALDILLGQRHASKLPFKLPPGARYAYKTGELEGVENEAGLIMLPGRSLALAFLAEGDVERAMPTVAPVAAMVGDFFLSHR